MTHRGGAGDVVIDLNKLVYNIDHEKLYKLYKNLFQVWPNILNILKRSELIGLDMQDNLDIFS